MNSIVTAFAKVCTCVAIFIGAPLVSASAVDFITVEITKDLEYRACLRTAQLDHNPSTICEK